VEAILTLQAGFVGVLGSTTISKMVSELLEFKGHLPIYAPCPKRVLA